jgi:hypothetical protein
MYKIVGGDQREYGPVTSDQVREWIASGRANGQTLAAFEGAPWKPLSTFPEFADALRTATPPPMPPGTGGTPGQPGQAYMGAKSNNLAVWGLVLSAVGICCSPLAIVGLVLSVVGLIQIQQNPQAYSTSKIVPILGIVLGLIGPILSILMFTSDAFQEGFREGMQNR